MMRIERATIAGRLAGLWMVGQLVMGCGKWERPTEVTSLGLERTAVTGLQGRATLEFTTLEFMADPTFLGASQGQYRAFAAFTGGPYQMPFDQEYVIWECPARSGGAGYPFLGPEYGAHVVDGRPRPASEYLWGCNDVDEPEHYALLNRNRDGGHGAYRFDFPETDDRIVMTIMYDEPQPPPIGYESDFSVELFVDLSDEDGDGVLEAVATPNPIWAQYVTMCAPGDPTCNPNLDGCAMNSTLEPGERLCWTLDICAPAVEQNPDIPETDCDGHDDDCDGRTDEGVDCSQAGDPCTEDAGTPCTSSHAHPFCPESPGTWQCVNNQLECILTVGLTPLEGPDSDGDGLLDHWETNGIDGDCDGVVDIDFPALRATFPAMADVNHKDLFVEIDRMQGEPPLSVADVAALKAAFAAAPVNAGSVLNPDGMPGINLWLDTENGDALGGGGQIPASSVSKVLSRAMAQAAPSPTHLFPPTFCCGEHPHPAYSCPTEMPLLDCRFERLRATFFADVCCTSLGTVGSPNYDLAYDSLCPREGDPPRDCTQNKNFRELVFHYGVIAQPAHRGPVVEDGAPSGSCKDTLLGNAIDQRADGLADAAGVGALAADPDCALNPFGAEDGGRLMSCSDGIDGDGANQGDAASQKDPDCLPDPLLREPDGLGGFGLPGSCTDGLEQNVLALADGLDGSDVDCAGLPAGEDGFGPGSCFDGIDNGAGDGADGADADCLVQPVESGAGAGSCTNMNAAGVVIDDDGDGLANWNDPDCAGLPREDLAGQNSCWDGLNNGDGADTADRTADCFIGATGEDGSGDPRTCLDGIDNAADGRDNFDLVDCYDAMGAYQVGFAEDGGLAGSCSDGRDNAADGADGLDGTGDCPALPTEDGFGPLSCVDNVDNGGDGAKDDLDPDCVGVPAGMVEDGAGPGSCADGIDNLSDGIDGTDPACIFPGGMGSNPWGFIEFNHDAGSLMHELGHTLGLGHGGPAFTKVPKVGGGFDYVSNPNANTNCKPNYVSVMNYLHQFGLEVFNPALAEGPTAAAGSCGDALGADEDADGKVNAQDQQCYDRTFDYSPPLPPGLGRRAPLFTLVESALSEAAILDLADSVSSTYFVDAQGIQQFVPIDGYNAALPEGVGTCGNGMDDDGVGGADRADPNCHAYDFDGNGVITPGLVVANVNTTNPAGFPGGCKNNSFGEVLAGADDWLHLRMAAVGTDAAGASPEPEEQLPTLEERDRGIWQSDLSVSLPEAPLTAGTDLPASVTADIENRGPKQAESARATVTLSGGLAFDALPTVCEEAGARAVCYLGRMLRGEVVELEFDVVVTPDAPGVSRGVTVSVEPYGAVDPDRSNNRASIGIDVLPIAVFGGAAAECNGANGTVVVLDGSQSTDPAGGALDYAWQAAGITFTGGDTGTPSGVFPLGQTEVTLTVTNELGLTDVATGVVLVEDTSRPTITAVPGDITTTNCSISNIGTLTATDACGGAVTITKNAPTKFPPGTTTVTWTVGDARGNSDTVTQRVTVLLGDDPACCPAGTHVMTGTSNNDTINGTSGADCIIAKGAQDTINGNGGNDFISGGDGDDIINAGAGNDAVFAGSGQDNVNGSSGNDTLYGGDGDDTLAGGTNDDFLNGGQGQDTLKGEDGNDQLFGEAGSDNLQGGAGSDLLTGGASSDTCTDSGGGSVIAQCENGAANACTDGVKDGTETDLDCGGACTGCASGLVCRTGIDCASSLFCVGLKCAAP